MGNNESSILKTILYSDIFDYPLTEKELYYYAIAETSIEENEFFRTLNKMPRVSSKYGFFCIKGRERICEKRLQREKIAERKIHIARRVGHILFLIPTILCIGISGGLAMRNAQEHDDIDFFLITKDNTIWMTRFFVLICLQLLGKRRKRKDMHVSNTICVNMLIDEKHMAFSKNRQDLYTAHEVVQMKPLFTRNEYDKKFLSANKWVKMFLPHTTKTILDYKQIQKNSFNGFLVILFLQPFEWCMRNLQLWYMRRHKTVEITEQGFVAFHPREYREFVDAEFAKRLNTYGIQI